jgi:transcriptional regulator with XRE-family HTH domain
VSKRGLPSYLKKARRKSGLTQKEAEKALGLNNSNCIKCWESGDVPPPLFILRKLAKLYNVEFKELFEVLAKDTKLDMVEICDSNKT